MRVEEKVLMIETRLSVNTFHTIEKVLKKLQLSPHIILHACTPLPCRW